MKKLMLAHKPGSDPAPLLALVREYVPSPAHVVLVSLVRVGSIEGGELSRLDETKAEVAAVAADLEGSGYTVTEDVSVVVPGSDGFQLTQKATDHAVDLAVFALGHRGRVGKAVMGSDAQRLLLGLTCPVLAIRPT